MLLNNTLNFYSNNKTKNELAQVRIQLQSAISNITGASPNIEKSNLFLKNYFALNLRSQPSLLPQYYLKYYCSPVLRILAISHTLKKNSRCVSSGDKRSQLSISSLCLPFNFNKMHATWDLEGRKKHTMSLNGFPPKFNRDVCCLTSVIFYFEHAKVIDFQNIN